MSQTLLKGESAISKKKQFLVENKVLLGGAIICRKITVLRKAGREQVFGIGCNTDCNLRVHQIIKTVGSKWFLACKNPR